VTPTEIHIGALYYKAFYGDALIGAEARLKRLNDAGGVYGRKIVIDNTLDDGQDNNTDLADAKSLVQQDHEFAIAPVMTASFNAASYLNSAQVPYLGWSIQPVWCNQQWGFGFVGADCDPTTRKVIGDFAAAEQNLFPDHTAQGKTLAFVTEDNQSAEISVKLFTASWVHHGIKVVSTDNSMPTPPAVTSDYTPYAEKVMTANGGKPADMVVMVLSVSDTLGLYKKLVELGYKGVVQNFDLYDPRLAATTPGLVTEIQFAPFEAAGTILAVQQMVTDLKAYEPGIVLSQPAAAGYWTMDLFIAILEKVGPNLTRQSFMNVANGNFHYAFGGGSVPVTFPAYHTILGPCGAFVQSTGTGFTVPVPFGCYTTYPNPLYKKS